MFSAQMRAEVLTSIIKDKSLYHLTKLKD